MHRYILDGNGEPVPCPDLLTWAQWFETADRGVGRDVVGKVRVSTVFLGLDHSFGHGAPMLFETMIFGGPHDQAQWRYTSRKEALAGHAAAVALVTPVNKKRVRKSAGTG